MSLSDEITWCVCIPDDEVVKADKVKEAVKELKKELLKTKPSHAITFALLEEIFGPKLCGDGK